MGGDTSKTLGSFSLIRFVLRLNPGRGSRSVQLYSAVRRPYLTSLSRQKPGILGQATDMRGLISAIALACVALATFLLISDASHSEAPFMSSPHQPLRRVGRLFWPTATSSPVRDSDSSALNIPLKWAQPEVTHPRERLYVRPIDD